MSKPLLPAPAPVSARPVEILVVDDSAVVRQALKAIIEEEPGFHVQTAIDPYDAVEVMSRRVPDAIVLDVDMPRMDGLTFLKKLMRQHPLPVLLCTDHAQRGLAALELGAREVVAKPDWKDARRLIPWAARLRESLRIATNTESATKPTPLSKPASTSASASAPARESADAILPRRPYVARGAACEPIIVIGASTGGVQAVARLLADLPRATPGIVIVQHMPDGFTGAYAERLNRDPKIALEVREAKPNEPIRPGVALVVPGSAHGLVRRVCSGYRVELVDGPPVNRHRPSVDVLFRSTAQSAGPHAAGVLLTGMGDDGAQGMLEMHEPGGLTIAQDQPTCIVFGMPREAIRRGGVRQVLPLDRIAGALLAWSSHAHY